MKAIDVEERTVEEAIQKALTQLQVRRDQVSVEILDEGSRGIFGIGSKPARVKVTLNQPPHTELSQSVQPPQSAPQSQASADEDEHEELDEHDETSPATPIVYDEQTLQQITTKAQEALHTILDSLQIEYTVDTQRHEDQILLNIQCENENFLIGRRGATLDAVQYLVNRIANKNVQQKIQVVLDTSDYRVNRNDRLQKLALRLSRKVKMTGKPVTVSPMNPHDRRIIHLTLQDDPGIRTLSKGTGFMRRITISTSRNANRNRKQPQS